MQGGMEARWQHTSQFRMPVYFLVFDKYKHWGKASIYSPSRPFPKESQLSSCYSNYNAQCPTNAKGGFNLGARITPLAASVFILSNRHYLRLTLQTESIPNGHQAQAQRQWETSVTEEKHLNLPGSCRVTWYHQVFARPAWGKRASRVSASWKRGTAVDKKPLNSLWPWMMPLTISHCTHTHSHTHTQLIKFP